jgi:acetyltransferase-like isoleucine patch superfamily enzyme
MNPNDVSLSADLRNLWQQMIALRAALRRETQSRYRRINPFAEDLFDWKEKGAVAGDDTITIYESVTIVGDVSIGEHTWVGPFCSLDGSGGLTIGRYCSISAACHIFSHDTARWALSEGRSQYERSPVAIGDGCFLGAASVVTRGVTIGSHVLVGAGAVVTTDLPSYSIAFGVPARVAGRVEVAHDGTVALKFDDVSRSV